MDLLRLARVALPCALGALTLSACPSTNTVGDDAGPASDDTGMVLPRDAFASDTPRDPVDAFLGVDAAATSDARAAETCTTPGTLESVSCGRCGTQSRFCTSARVWEYDACSEPADAVCDPGTMGTAPCGDRCGTVSARCDAMCHFIPSGACGGEGECTPGSVERTADGCASGATRGRSCSATCGWGMFGTCTDTPDDFDGDGVSYANDCDDTDASIVIGSTEACGLFVCNGAPPMDGVTGSRTCVGPGWSVCARPATCVELPPASCGAMSTYFETRSCATEGCDTGATEFRECRSGAWSSWSGCVPARPRPATCDAVASTCGACGEGVAFSVCDAACAPTLSECFGVGCVPGTRRRSTTGCAAGEYRETLCSASCAAGAPGACMAFRPEVDVLLLVDNTGSHTGLVMENAARLATELVGGLLADADVRVGVASFADFPRGAYGSSPDEPFRALLAPTSDMATITAALTGLEFRGGGDLPESGVEALYVAAGGLPHPDSFPFACAMGLGAGGCWRASAQRAVVMLTDITQHNIPSPAYMGGAVIDPYLGFMPVPPTWATARDQMIATNVAFFAMVPEPGVFSTSGDGDAPSQMRFMASELAQEPDDSIVVYPAGERDLTTASRAMVANLRAYLGLTP